MQIAGRGGSKVCAKVGTDSLLQNYTMLSVEGMCRTYLSVQSTDMYMSTYTDGGLSEVGSGRNHDSIVSREYSGKIARTCPLPSSKSLA